MKPVQRAKKRVKHQELEDRIKSLVEEKLPTSVVALIETYLDEHGHSLMDLEKSDADKVVSDVSAMCEGCLKFVEEKKAGYTTESILTKLQGVMVRSKVLLSDSEPERITLKDLKNKQ